MTLRQPSLFFRAIVLGAQGVFYNVFCMYLFLLMTVVESLTQWHRQHQSYLT